MEIIFPITYHSSLPASRLGLALSPRCLTCLRKHAWPGNVRELENFLERALLLTVQLVAPPESPGWDCLSLCPAAAFEDASCPGALETSEPAAHETQTAGLVSLPLSSSFGPGSSDVWPTLANVERDHLQRTLERANYNQQVAADLLGIHRQQLLRKLKKHFIDTSATRRGRPRKQDHS